MDKSSAYFWNENYGQIYPSLAELLKRKDVSMEVKRQKGKPDKKMYMITEQEKQILCDWLSQPMEHEVVLKKNDFLLRVFFGSNAPTDSIIQHIRDHKRKLEEALHVFEVLEKWLRTEERENPNFKYWLLTINYGKSQFRSLIKWCDESIKEIR
ncbi:PadR family transcriptional regulator [Bacillus haynesii]|uniref:PadR family transcriptional regulator n=1 Tax=Bacillus haynesii TaxID=1925021 RepID=UPI00227FC230|nr:PadR family transcriptional regulator [Bacillus haynesii]MCY8224347.1 PadR family transcriptional regulator [Bacillus haynesii]